jgi:hypothetical protein
MSFLILHLKCFCTNNAIFKKQLFSTHFKNDYRFWESKYAVSGALIVGKGK